MDIYGDLGYLLGLLGNLSEIGDMFVNPNGYLIISIDIHLNIFYIRIYPRNPL
jgi:hypothetical protein